MKLRDTPAECTTCGHILSAYTHVGPDDIEAEEGDLSVCFYCGTMSEFNSEGNLTPLSERKLKEIAEEAPSLMIYYSEHINLFLNV